MVRPVALQIALAACLLAGCGASPGAQAPSAHVEAGAAEVPADAIPIGDQLYMVPAGVDRTGCPWFRAFSPTKMVVQAMFYRAAEGGFTMDRVEAVCAEN